MTVAVLGASDNPERYSYQAVKFLLEKHHEVFPIHPRLKQVQGQKVYASLDELPKPVDTLTLYVGPEMSSRLEADILRLKPARIIFNPGAENPGLESRAAAQGIKALVACTLVLLRTNQFDR